MRTLRCAASARLCCSGGCERRACRAVVSELVAVCGFGFKLERVVFVAVLHRLMVSGSDRS